MIRRGNTTVIVTIALCVVLCVAMACGTVVYLGGKPAPSTPDAKPKARLAELVPDADAQARLDGFYSDWAAILRQSDKPCKTTGDFRDAYRRSIVTTQGDGRIPSVKAIDEPIQQRIADAIGKDDNALDGEPPLRASLAAVLSSVSDDFGGR
jgi:hypothetical protein